MTEPATLSVQQIQDALRSAAGRLQQNPTEPDSLLLAAEELGNCCEQDWQGVAEEYQAAVRELISLLREPACENNLGADTTNVAVFVETGLQELTAALDGAPEDGGRAAQVCTAARRQLESVALTTGNGDWDLPSSDSDSLALPALDEVEHLLQQVERIGAQTARCGPPDTVAQQTPADGPAGFRSVESEAGFPIVPTVEMEPIDPELRDAFLDDANQCLSQIEQIALDGHDLFSLEQIRLMCRELHTLKGASASVGLSALAGYLHALEEWLSESAQATQTARRQILEAVDAVRGQIGGLPNDARPATPDSNPANADHGLPLEFSLEASRSEKGAETLRIRTAQLDRLMDMLAELVTLRKRRDSSVNKLKSIHDELNASVRRLRNTIDFGGQVIEERTAVDAHSDPASLAQSGGMLSKTTALTEVADDFAELSLELRDVFEPVAEDNRLISQFTRQFRQELTELRRLPLLGLFERLQRGAYDAAQIEAKQVQMKLLGAHAGLERSVQERLYEPLLHLVRNAVCHGIESSEERRRAGKPEQGVIEVEAFGGSHLCVVEVRDDGRGLDYERIRQQGSERGLIRFDRPASRDELSQLIFHPGFSTRAEANEVAGRGVGMDVVRSAVERLHARIEVESEPGRGTTVRLLIPLHSVIEHTMVLRCGGQLFSLPMQFIKRTSTSGSRLESHRDADQLNYVDLAGLLSQSPEVDESARPHIVIANQNWMRDRLTNHDATEHRDIGLVVDGIVGPDEVVVRPLPSLLKPHPLLTGATLSGTGEVVLMLDCHALLQASLRGKTTDSSDSYQYRNDPDWSPSESRRVLVVDDSVSARRSLTRLLKPWGFDTEEAVDGAEALEKLRGRNYEIVFTDLDMPRLNGMDLLTEISGMRTRPTETVVVVSSHGGTRIREQVAGLGAHAFLSKPVDEESLREALQRIGPHQFAAIQMGSDS